MDYFTIYRITNNINGKYYIGKHQTKNLNDDYMGSGKLLMRAIKKYGIDNFSKEILFIFDNEEEMNAKEKELVIISEETYNLCEGGKGGFGYINRNGLQVSENQKRAASLAIRGNKYWSGKKHTKETKQKLSDGKVGSKNPFYGKKHKKDSLEKNRKANLYFTYKIQIIDTEEIIDVDSLKLFCEEHNLIYSNMRQRGYSKGFKIISKNRIKNG